MKYLLIKAGIVLNVIIAPSSQIANQFKGDADYIVQVPFNTYVGPGFSYDPVTKILTPPPDQG